MAYSLLLAPYFISYLVPACPVRDECQTCHPEQSEGSPVPLLIKNYNTGPMFV